MKFRRWIAQATNYWEGEFRYFFRKKKALKFLRENNNYDILILIDRWTNKRVVLKDLLFGQADTPKANITRRDRSITHKERNKIQEASQKPIPDPSEKKIVEPGANGGDTSPESIAAYLRKEDFPPEHLRVIMDIVVALNWSKETKQKVFEFAHTIKDHICSDIWKCALDTFETRRRMAAKSPPNNPQAPARGV